MSSQLFLVPCRNTITNIESSFDDTESWRYTSTPSVRFSDCGSFCSLTFNNMHYMVLESNLLEGNPAKMQIPAVWGNNISYDQRSFQVRWCEQSRMVKLYEHYRKPTLPRDPGVAITAVPAHLASGAVYLLAGRSGDDLTRMLFLPKKGPPEIKNLRVTLNQILDELAAEVTRNIRWEMEAVRDSIRRSQEGRNICRW